MILRLLRVSIDRQNLILDTDIDRTHTRIGTVCLDNILVLLLFQSHPATCASDDRIHGVARIGKSIC